MNQECVECQKKDQKIKELKQKIAELEEQIETFGPEFSQVKGLDENSQKLLKENIQKAIGDLIGQDPNKLKTNQLKAPFQRTQTSNLTEFLRQPNIDEQHTYLGQRFFEHFLIIGPDLEELQQVNKHTNEIIVKPKILYQFPNVNEHLYDVVPIYTFPNGILAKKLETSVHNFNDKVLPELKQIIMQTLQLTKGDNEYSITIPREDIQDNSRMTVSEFVQESNPNVFRNIICFEINEFICLDPKTYGCWLCPIVHCFVSYYPFIKFFLKENANIWNQLKLERIEPCLSETSSHEVLKRDFIYMKNKLNTIIDRLFALRSIQVTYDQKYQLNEIQIQTPKKDSAQYLQFLWGCDQTFQNLSFKELIYLISHVLLSQRVILFCKKKSVLSHIMLTIISLMHPFNYKLPFCIFIPDELIDRLAAPCPYFFGVVGEYDNYCQRIEEAQQEDITMFDINTKRVYFSKNQSRDLKKCIAPIKRNSHLKQLYSVINNSRENAFKQIGKHKLQKLEKSGSSNQIFKENEKQYMQLLKDIAKSFQTFWHSTVTQHIPVDRKFIKTGSMAALNLQLLSEVMLSKCPKDSKRFIKELIQNPTFTGYLDELYEGIYQQNQ
ncbi:unnamed protein product [Paramecium pentaurelia]|uniref:UDENN domain-containing protein n=1 Tax=Paramecium pentaurelia TaxID=43138 RepID=A0A8S1X779_9CILI|nr:unnamed protein product [Paramecium pentaurelia]